MLAGRFTDIRSLLLAARDLAQDDLEQQQPHFAANERGLTASSLANKL